MRRNKTLFGMLAEDPELLSGLAVPAGMTASTLAEIIKDRSGLLPCWIQSAARLKSDVSLWCTYRLPDWTRAYQAMTTTYNPIHNYDREELGTEEIARHHGTKRTISENVEESPGVTTTNTGYVVPYDASVESETGKSTLGYTGKNTRSADPAKNYETISDVDANTYDKDVHTYVNRKTIGNIGVTRTQEMIGDELRLRLETDLYERIACEFEDKFLIQSY